MQMTIAEILINEAERLEAKAQSLRTEAAQPGSGQTVDVDNLNLFIDRWVYDLSTKELREELIDDVSMQARFVQIYFEDEESQTTFTFEG